MLRHCYVCKRASPTGEHVVHRDVCPYEALPEDRDELGDFETCREAIVCAIFRGYSNVYDLQGLPSEDDGCTVCPECGSAWRINEQPE